MPGSTANRAYPYPVVGDPMCHDPTYGALAGAQTALRSLANAVDADFHTNFDPDLARITASPRVRVSRTNFDSSINGITAGGTFDTVEFNIGTSTDLTIDNQYLRLPSGLWAIIGELSYAPAVYDAPASGEMYLLTNGALLPGCNVTVDNVVVTSSPFGGAVQASTVLNLSAASTGQIGLSIPWITVGGIAKYAYKALTAMRISDYF